ncbi:MAG: hypothetical protein ACK5LK_07175 [Chthoniobacterales bacterium]
MFLPTLLRISCALLAALSFSSATIVKSHPPLHEAIFSDDREIPDQGVYFVNPKSGDDSQDGSKDSPWRTLNHAMTQLVAGDTLLLREGVYFENVVCSVVGQPDKPITIRSYPGEKAIIDGGIPVFQTNPASAWESGENPGEFISTKSYRNIRDVLGLFGDSMIGLQTYWHLEYLLSSSDYPASRHGSPFYCGPGLFYNKATGRIHIRLAHTNMNIPGFVNYRGESDPRKLPLVIAPFRSIPLFLDQAMHVRFRDLIIRGGGWETLKMNFAVNVEFDFVTIYGGSYCIRSKNSGPVRMTNCGVIGQIPPWGFWSDNALKTYDPLYYDPFTQPPEAREAHNVARLPTHALLIAEGGEESDIFFYPFNNNWTLSQCEFKDSHDGLYLNGRHMTLDHSYLTRIQDDGIYLSAPTPYMINDDVHIFRNYIYGTLSAFGAHLRGVSKGDIWIYGNIIDKRMWVPMYRPVGKDSPPELIAGNGFIAHGRGKPAGMENIHFYHNTFLLLGSSFAGSTFARVHPDSTREVMNNIFVYIDKLPTPNFSKPLDGLVNLDGNLHWAPGHASTSPEEWLDAIRNSTTSKANVSDWGGQLWAVHSLYADPDFLKWNPELSKASDFGISPTSPAAKAAITLPANPPLRDNVAGSAIGALQPGQSLRVGINGRILAGSPQPDVPILKPPASTDPK